MKVKSGIHLPWLIYVSLSFCNISSLAKQLSESVKHIHLQQQKLDGQAE